MGLFAFVYPQRIMGVIFNTCVLGMGWIEFEFVYPPRIMGMIFSTLDFM
jgi:hypothetical protein